MATGAERRVGTCINHCPAWYPDGERSQETRRLLKEIGVIHM